MKVANFINHNTEWYMNHFNEEQFLNSVKKFCKNVGSVNREKGAKMVVAYAIRENQFDMVEVFTYLKTQLKRVYPESTQMMKSIPDWYLKHTARHLGMTPKMLAIELTIDTIGWIRLVNHLASMEENQEETTTHIEKRKHTRRTNRENQTPVVVGIEEHKPIRGRHRRQIVQLNMDGTIVKEWDSAGAAATHLGKESLRSSIIKCCQGDSKYPSVKGFIWKYKTEENSKELAAA